MIFRARVRRTTYLLFWVVILPCLGFGPGRLGQAIDATEREILRRLRSDEPGDVAWGAYEAGARRLKSVQTELIEALESCRERHQWEWSLAEGAVLDALIRLDAVVPDNVLTSLIFGSPSNAELVLFAKSARMKDGNGKPKLTHPRASAARVWESERRVGRRLDWQAVPLDAVSAQRRCCVVARRQPAIEECRKGADQAAPCEY